jgi:hypothetical protein
MSILLSDEGICKACPAVGMRTTDHKQLRCSPAKCLVHPDFKNTAKAAAIHAVQYLEETCGCIADRVSEGGWPYKHPIEHRYECTTHMAEIHKELGI